MYVFNNLKIFNEKIIKYFARQHVYKQWKYEWICPMEEIKKIQTTEMTKEQYWLFEL